MILYELKCTCGHQFEGWFRDSASFDEQIEFGEIDCPMCGSGGVSKALMAPNIAPHGLDRGTVVKGNPMGAMFKTLAKLRSHVESTCDYVGEGFAEEARKIHYGEAKARGIYGEATRDESEALRDEGVEFMRLPMLPRHDA